KAKRIKLGPPLERETKMGPLVSKEQYDRVSSYLEIGKKEAKIAIGGRRAKEIWKGYYLEPTIFYDVDNNARISREEIFGPVASVIPFDDEAGAIRIANDTPYGLAAAVWTRDIYKAFRVVKAVRAGIFWPITCSPPTSKPPGEATNSLDSAASWDPGGWKNILKPSRCSSISMKRPSLGISFKEK